MEKNYYDELYEILDEMNAQIEEIVNGCEAPEANELLISLINQKSKEFIDDLQHEVEKLEFVEIEYWKIRT